MIKFQFVSNDIILTLRTKLKNVLETLARWRRWRIHYEGPVPTLPAINQTAVQTGFTV